MARTGNLGLFGRTRLPSTFDNNHIKLSRCYGSQQNIVHLEYRIFHHNTSDQKVHFPLPTFVHGFEAHINSGQNRFPPTRIGRRSERQAQRVAAVTLGTGWLFGAFWGQGSPIGSAALASQCWCHLRCCERTLVLYIYIYVYVGNC